MPSRVHSTTHVTVQRGESLLSPNVRDQQYVVSLVESPIGIRVCSVSRDKPVRRHSSVLTVPFNASLKTRAQQVISSAIRKEEKPACPAGDRSPHVS